MVTQHPALPTSPATDDVRTLADALRLRARRRPDDEVLRVVGRSAWTADQLWRATAAVAQQVEPLVAPGEVVVTAAETGAEALVASAAVAALGAVELPLSPEMRPDWARRLVTTSAARAVLATPPRTTPRLTGLADAARLPLLQVDETSVRDAPPGADIQPVPRQVTDPALIMTTSGTTGRTKAALLPVGAPIGQARRVAGALAYGPGDVLLSMFAWHHINARNACFLPALITDARVVVTPRFSASGFLDLARAEGITAFNFMGALCSMLLAQPPRPDDHDHLIRAAYGGPAPAGLVTAFADRFGVTLRQAYACTELGDVATTSVEELRPGAAGRIVTDYEVKIVDESLEPVGAGEQGEVLVRPLREGLAFLKYLDDEAATRAAWADGWFRTRDRGRLEDDWLRIEGRCGDVIRRRGVNIDPQVVEEAALEHPAVADAAAIAVSSELTEDEVLLVVVPGPGGAPEPADLLRHCLDHLPRHMAPRYLSVEDSLPHNSNLKTDRAALRGRGLPAGVWDAQSRAAMGEETR